MATLTKFEGHWLLTVHHKGNLATDQKSSGPKIRRLPSNLNHMLNLNLFLNLQDLEKPPSTLSFPVLTDHFLKANKNRSKNTQGLYEYVLRSYNSGKPLPTNQIVEPSLLEPLMPVGTGV